MASVQLLRYECAYSQYRPIAPKQQNNITSDGTLTVAGGQSQSQTSNVGNAENGNKNACLLSENQNGEMSLPQASKIFQDGNESLKSMHPNDEFTDTCSQQIRGIRNDHTYIPAPLDQPISIAQKNVTTNKETLSEPNKSPFSIPVVYTAPARKAANSGKRTSKPTCNKTKMKMVIEHTPDGPETKVFRQCDFCDQTFKHRSTLYVHKKRFHARQQLDDRKQRANYMCLDCGNFTGDNIQQLIQHYRIKHHRDMPVHTQKFSTEQDFFNWKKQVEEKTSSLYTKSSMTKISSGFHVSYYHCHHSGKPRVVAREYRVRSPRIKGSCKMGHMCTGYVTMRKDTTDGTVSAEYCLEHSGHGSNFASFPLSSDKKETAHTEVGPKVIVRQNRENDTLFQF